MITPDRMPPRSARTGHRVRRAGRALTVAVAAAAAVVAAAMVAVAPTPAAAQGSTKGAFGDWQIRCDVPPGAKSEQCALVQRVADEIRSNVALDVIVLKTADKKTRILRVVAPLGVLLPSRLGLKIDQTDIGRTEFVRCLPTGCIAEVMMDDALLAKFSTGKLATFIIFQTPEEGIGIPINLEHFAEGFEKL
jgi:invasion protein IalB